MTPVGTKGRDRRVANMEYLEFELEIEYGRGRQYPVAVLNSPAGQGRETMHFPFSDQELERHLGALQAALFHSGGQHRTPPSEPAQTVQTFGQALFDALFAGEVGVLFGASRHQATRQDKGLCLKLRIQPPGLAALPWELLYDSRAAEYVCLSPATSVVRYQEPPRAIDLLIATPPLRVLVMASAPDDLPPLDVDRERQRLEEALEPLQARDLVELHWVEGQTWGDLNGAIWSGHWHAFHFIGHGGLDASTGESFIVLANDDGQSQPLSLRHLGWLLVSHEPLHLVWLSSSGKAQSGEQDRFSSTATALVQRGVPAVLTMQYQISGQSMAEFARAFYEALTATMPVDLAIAEARAAVYSQGIDTAEWAVPALYTYFPQLRVFERETLVTTVLHRGDEALAKDDFAKAISQYTLAIEMGAGPGAQDRRDLAEEASQKLRKTQNTLGTLTGSAEDQASVVSQVVEELKEIRMRLPDSQAIEREFLRAQKTASEIRDALWKRGQRLMDRGAVGLTPGRRRKRYETSTRLLEKAAQVDPEETPALREDLARAKRRLRHLQLARPGAASERLWQLRMYFLIGAAVACVLLIVLLVTDLVPISSLVARATPTLVPALSQTTRPTLVAETTEILISTPSRTAELTVVPTRVATSTPGPTHSPTPTGAPPPMPSHTSTNTPMPQVSPQTREPTATQTWTVTPIPSPTRSSTATATPRPVAPRPSPTKLPTATPSPGIVYPAPTLLLPEDIAYLSQDALGTYRLSWTWTGTLQADEWFDVRIWQAGMPHYGIAWTKQREYPYDICLRGSGDFYWTVAVIRGERGQWKADLSPEAVPHRFTSSRYDDWCSKHGRDIIPPVPGP